MISLMFLSQEQINHLLIINLIIKLMIFLDPMAKQADKKMYWIEHMGMR